MKKIVAGILTLVLVFGLCACGSAGRQEPSAQSQAKQAIKEEDYEKAVELLGEEEEKDDLFYKASEQLFLQKLDEAKAGYDAEATIAAVEEYCSATEDEKFPGEKLTALVKELAEGSDDNAIKYASKVAAGCKNRSFGDELQEILDSVSKKRVKAFLQGEWVRIDGTQNSPMCVNVKGNDDDFIGIITYAPSGLKFQEKDIKWRYFEIFDGTTLTYSDLDSGGYYNYYSMELDYDHDMVYPNLYFAGASKKYSNGRSQCWVKKELVDKYSDVKPLAEEDYIVREKNAETGETADYDCATDFSRGKYRYYYFDEVNDRNREEVVKTARGITLGSTREEVLKAYGIDAARRYSDSYDAIRYAAKQSKLEGLMTACDLQETQLIYMDPSGKNCLAFGFDENDEVVLIIAAPKTVYWRDI